MSELVILRASGTEALVEEMNRVAAFLDRVPSASLADIACTCALGEGDSAVAFVVETVQDLRTRLMSAASRIAGGSLRRIRDKSGTYWNSVRLLGDGGGKLAFVFPGVASFYPDMMRDLAIEQSACRSAFDELEEALAQNGGDFTPSNFVFPPAPYYRHDADVFSSGAYAQGFVSAYTGCVAMARLLSDCALHPDGVVGFAGGDLASMVLAGFAGKGFDRPTRVKLIRDIYRVVDKAVDHSGLPETAMVSLLLRDEHEADAVLASFPPGRAVLAVDLSPRQKTFAVDAAFADTAMEAFAEAGVRAMRLALNRPFNTEKCAKLVPAIRKFTDAWMKGDPDIEVWSCATAAPHSARLRKARGEMAERWASPARFGATVRAMHEAGYRVFLEVGPRGLMTTAVDDALKDLDHAAVATNSIHRRGVPQVMHALAQLAALGAVPDRSAAFRRRGAKVLDFDAQIAPSTRRETEMRLSRAFPRMTLLSEDTPLKVATTAFVDPKGRGARAAQRAAAVAAQARRARQFDFGALNPLVSDADAVSHSPGVSIEVKKTFSLKEAPFIGDFALGGSQISYAEPELRGFVQMTMPLAAEIMAEVAAMLAPNRILSSIEDLVCRRAVAFEDDVLTVLIRAERVASGSPDLAAVKVQLRDDSPGSAYTWPVMEATFVLSKNPPQPRPVSVPAQFKPRTVHWSGRDIYPFRLSCGPRLRGITFAETWSETGIDYEVEVPQLAGCVTYTRFPLWLVNPLLMEVVVSGYTLWHSHERFSRWIGKERMDDAYSSPFRMRRMDILAPLPKEGSRVKCYLRLTGVTPKSHLCDIVVSDGDGGAIATISGWEERVEHVRSEYRDLIMQPATSFVTKGLSREQMGNPSVDVSSAYVTEVPYPVFERNAEVWLQTFAHMVLGAKERADFRRMPGSAARRTEWLFGRIAAKEAVRRFLKDYHQARWSYADVTVFADDLGKPYAVGAWMDQLRSKLDIAIAHTSRFVIGLAAANARVGVDVESVGRDLSQEFTDGVFMPDELELAAKAAGPVSHAILRFWCAKEAVSKALGTGIRYSPKEMVVSGYEPDVGRLTMRLDGAWGDAFRNLKGRDLPVTVKTMHDHALAFCFLPAALFAED